MASWRERATNMHTRVIRIELDWDSDQRMSSTLEEIIHWLGQSDYLREDIRVISSGSEGTILYPLRRTT